MKNLLLVNLFLYAFSFTNAQKNTISGTVTSIRDNLQLFDATVRIKGGATTTTSSDGSFSLPTSKEEETLEITSVGFAANTFKARAGKKVSIPLLTDVRTLNEVVVTGVGVATNKKKLGISVESITADRLLEVRLLKILNKSGYLKTYKCLPECNSFDAG
jgi:hypothetical protein